jgi:hypothetical protein
MSQPEPFERIVTSALLCLSDHYHRALHSGSLALRTNAHNLLPRTPTHNTTSSHTRTLLNFGTIHLTTTTYIYPRCQTWSHAELHIKASVNFAGDDDNAVPFRVEEKIRGSAEDVMKWERDFRTRLAVWCQEVGRGGYFRVVRRGLEVEESEERVGDVVVGS